MKLLGLSLLVLISSFSFATKSDHELFTENIEKRRSLLTKIDELEAELSELESFSLDQGNIWHYSDQIVYLENENRDMQKDVEDIRTGLRRAYRIDTNYFNKEIESNKAEIKTLRDLLEADDKNTETIRDKWKELEQTKTELQDLEVQINIDLYTNDHENWFKSVLSWIFCGLVLTVIVGFFWITNKKEEIARNIFSGDHGIQFITLFLLIISIILFGIMGVLQGRELGALIGGISGYILGRSGNALRKNKDEDEGNPDQNDPNQTVVASS